MCLILPYKETVESMQKIAKRNIKCYKVVRNGYFPGCPKRVESLYNRFIYNIGKHYKMDGFGWKYKQYSFSIMEVHDGFHSYKEKKLGKKWFDTSKQNLVPNNIQLVKCIIPKGATYIEVDGYYVSTEIIVKKIIKK